MLAEFTNVPALWVSLWKTPPHSHLYNSEAFFSIPVCKILILFSQTLGTPFFSSFCLLPVNIRKRFATSHVKHQARNYIYKSANCSIFSSLITQHNFDTSLPTEKKCNRTQRAAPYPSQVTFPPLIKKTSIQNTTLAAAKMPRNSFNTYDPIRGAGGPPAPDRSTYPAILEFDETRPNSNSENQLAQNSTSNPSRQYDDNNRGANSASRGNSSSSATSGQSYRYPQEDGYSSSSSNRNQNDNRDSRSSLPVPRSWNSPDQDFQSQGANYPNSNSLSDSRMAIYEGQPQREGTYDAVGGIYSDYRGGSGGYGTAGRVNQSGGYGRGHGGRSSGNVEREYDNGDGDEDSLAAVQGSEASGRSSGSRR